MTKNTMQGDFLKTFQEEQDKEFDKEFVHVNEWDEQKLNLFRVENYTTKSPIVPHHDKIIEDLKSYIHSRDEALLKRIGEEIEKILTDEIATAHTSESGKTSRLTSAYMRIKNILQ